MRWWKLLGLAGVAGVAATGVVVARAERKRRAYTPDEVRARLHARVDQAEDQAEGQVEGQAESQAEGQAKKRAGGVRGAAGKPRRRPTAG
ncbi:hypothetical protein ACQPYE_11365 [Actinosynnema sp. CA-299493]